jgi:hypothetical protein
VLALTLGLTALQCIIAAIHLNLQWIKRWSQHEAAWGSIALVPIVAMLAFRINQLASPHSADGPRAAFGANAVGELAGDVVAQWKLGRMYAAPATASKRMICEHSSIFAASPMPT